VSGATSISGAANSAIAPTPQDGVVVSATTHLRPVKYPNRLDDIGVIGRTGTWKRAFMLRPKYAGRFLFLLYPSEDIAPDRILSEPVHFPGFNTAPKVLEFTIPQNLREFRVWNWRLVKTTFEDDEEADFELLDAMQHPPDGFIDPPGAAFLAAQAEQEEAYSHLLFETRPALEGSLRFSEEMDISESRAIAWSCHQPYESQDGKPALHANSKGVMDWLRQYADRFDPHRIWALGDTCYSDGIGELNFVKQVNDKTGWHNDWALRKDLLSLYRLNYRYHWSFSPMQALMRNYPHIAMWDDHEIRDGYGSDANDFTDENRVMKDIASQAAQDYLFSWNEPLRSESGKNIHVDNHLAYVDGPLAAYIFDGRNNRSYGDDIPVPPEVPVVAGFLLGLIGGAVLGAAGGPVGAIAGGAAGAVAGTAASVAVEKEVIELYRWHNPGEVISDQQLQDFRRYCNHIRGLTQVRYLMLGNAVPFIYINDLVEALASEMELTATDVGQNIRDDIRDSWHSPSNQRQLSRLVDILRELHQARPDIEIINISGDIHISNAFSAEPEGFSKPIFQITSSALTNRISLSDSVTNLLSVDGGLSAFESSGIFGDIDRLWHEGVFQNFLSVDANSDRIELILHVYNKDDDKSFGARDRKLVIRPNKGFTLTEG
jgi:hypothetical protein